MADGIVGTQILDKEVRHVGLVDEGGVRGRDTFIVCGGNNGDGVAGLDDGSVVEGSNSLAAVDELATGWTA